MVMTESELREMWRDGRLRLPAFPLGTRFSPAAQDFIKEQQLEIRFANLELAAPVADLKLTNPSGTLAASIDFLHALVLLSAAEARRYQLPALAQRLDALAADCLALLRAERAGQQPALPGPSSTAPQPAATPPPFAPPGATDHAIVHWLNLVRTAAGQAEALSAAGGQQALAARLRQVGAAAADLGRRVQSGELGWNSAMV